MKKLIGLVALPLLFGSMSVYAATAVTLNDQPTSFYLQNRTDPNEGYKEISRNVDFNNTLHVRLSQTYQGYPVWGGDAIAHIPNANARAPLNELINSTSTGRIYRNIRSDLLNTPFYIFNATQANKVMQASIRNYREQHQATGIHNESSQLMIYVDKSNKAHWAFLISFDVPGIPEKALPQKMKMMVDALTNQVYLQWNDLKTIDAAFGGGFGGNKKMGKVTYDGLNKDLPKLTIDRDDMTKTCFLRNRDVTVKDRSHDDEVISFACIASDKKHNEVYWDGDKDGRKGSYSPANDALYEGLIIKNMYQDWYKLPVLVKDGKPMMLNMVVHERMDNAYWDGEKMTFGDGIIMFYPLTSLDVASHEISHGFTEQHSNLVYDGQSGGLNEAFSDMAGKASEFYAFKTNGWKVGSQIIWIGDALRYMDKPSKDCTWWSSQCSIDKASQYKDGLDVHYSSGVYNRFFYLLATTQGWDTKKAFDVMVQANMNYWTPTATFTDAACGVLRAAKDYHFNIADVKAAFDAVEVDTSICSK